MWKLLYKRPIKCCRYTEKLDVYDFEITNGTLYIYTIKEDTIDYGINKETTKNKYTFKKYNNDYYMSAIEFIN